MENYLNELKIAVINEDLKKLEQITKKEPVFETIEEAKEIQAYLKEAVKLLQKEKNRLFIKMQKIKNLQKFNQKEKKEKINFKI
jgi:hypothetical protein